MLPPSSSSSQTRLRLGFARSYGAVESDAACYSYTPSTWKESKGNRARFLFVVAGEGSQGEGESKHPLPVRLFGDFLFAQKVTPRSDQQSVTAFRYNDITALQ